MILSWWRDTLKARLSPGSLRMSPKVEMGPRPLNGIFVTDSEHRVPKGLSLMSPTEWGLQFPFHPPPPPPNHHNPSPISLSKLLPAPAPLFCLCYLCLLLTAGPSLAAPRSEDYPIIPLAQHVLPSSRAISSASPSPLLPPRAVP